MLRGIHIQVTDLDYSTNLPKSTTKMRKFFGTLRIDRKTVQQMATAQSRQRTAGPRSGGRNQQGSVTPTAEPEAFPPLSISLANFIRDGSDREFRRLVYCLISLSGLMGRNQDHFAAYIGLSRAQAVMLSLIAETQDVTVGGIAERLGVSTQFVTMEVNKLIAKDIAEKRPNALDRRSSFLSLTEIGRTLLRELAPLRRSINDMTFRSLTEERARMLQEILDDLVMDARSAVHELESPQMRGKMAPSALAGSSGTRG